MLKLTHLSDEFYKLKGDNDYEISVSFMDPVEIYMYGSAGFQNFANPHRVGAKALSATFPNLAAIKEAALHYKEGLVIPSKLHAEFDRLAAEGIITPSQRLILKANFQSPSPNPNVIKTLMNGLGMGEIAPLMNFYEEKPELEKTCLAFKKFIDACSDYYKQKKESK